MAFYLDSSAIVKLVVAEPETDALLAWVAAATTPLVTSDLARAEVARAARRVDATAPIRVRDVLDALVMLSIPASVFDAAGRLEPATLRSLDALHLASALTLGDDLEAFVCYDERLAAAAESLGIRVIAPT